MIGVLERKIMKVGNIRIQVCQQIAQFEVVELYQTLIDMFKQKSWEINISYLFYDLYSGSICERSFIHAVTG